MLREAAEPSRPPPEQEGEPMNPLIIAAVAAGALMTLALSIRVVKQDERGVLFRLGRVMGVREPGLRLIVPVIDVLRRVSLRIVTMPIPAQEIITRDNVSIDVSAVAYYRVIDPVKSVVAIENVAAAINQIAQTTGGRALLGATDGA
jgi:regulator of protease activity HflC (stomatin/prohibitin superfamily)